MNSAMNQALALIEAHYGSRKAKRSRVPLMNHIVDGLDIIEQVAKHEALPPLSLSKTMAAFALHPLIQDGDELNDNLYQVLTHRGEVSAGDWLEVVALAVEYRDYANAYLCRPSTDGYCHKSLRNLLRTASIEVMVMLLADKRQNQTDFNLYHRGHHERSDQLAAYFNRWVTVLETALGIQELGIQETTC